MRHRIALTIQIHPRGSGLRSDLRGWLHVVDAETERPLRLSRQTFLLTLDREPEATFVRGQVQALGGEAYPIQSNLALFDALSTWLTRTEETP